MNDTVDVKPLNDAVKWRIGEIGSFLDEEYEEWAEKHYKNGVKRPKYRTREEKVSNCRRVIGWSVGQNGVMVPQREYPCHIITGDDPCEYCLDVRSYKRKQHFQARLDTVSERPLFFIELNDDQDAVRFRGNCSYHGYNYLSVPLNDNGRKVVIVDGPVKGSVPISIEKAKIEIGNAAAFLSENRSVRAGGSLGKIGSEKKHKNIVDVDVDIIGFVGEEADWVSIAKSHVLAMVKIGEKTEITAETLQSVVSDRNARILANLRDMGFVPYVKFTKTESFDLDIVMDGWPELVIPQPVLIGNEDSLDSVTRRILSLSRDELKEVLANDEKVMGNIVSIVGDELIGR